MPAAWAGVAASVVGTAASLAKGSGQSGALAGGAAAANGISQQAIDDGRSYMQADKALASPFISTGTSATNQLGALLGLGGKDAADAAMQSFQASPSYGYQMDQGLRAVDNGAASRGLLHSGATIKAEQTLGSNLANANFGNYLGRLAGLSTQGLQGLQLNNGSTSTFDGLLSKQSSDQSAVAGSLGAGQASIYGNTVGSLANTATNFLASDTGKNALSGLFGGSGGSSIYGGAGLGGSGLNGVAGSGNYPGFGSI